MVAQRPGAFLLVMSSIVPMFTVAQPHGQGSFSFFGNEYNGEWREGQKAGKGTFSYATGEVYEGDWDSDAPCALRLLLAPIPSIEALLHCLFRSIRTGD